MINQDDNWLNFSDDDEVFTDFNSDTSKQHGQKKSSKKKIITISLTILGVIFIAILVFGMIEDARHTVKTEKEKREFEKSVGRDSKSNTEQIDARNQVSSSENNYKDTSSIEKRNDFIDGYEFAEFDNFEKYNSFASENGLDGAKIAIHTTLSKTDIKESKTDSIPYTYILAIAKDGKKWIILTSGNDIVLDSITDGKPHIIKGKYQGYSDKYNCPTFFMEDGLVDIESPDYQPPHIDNKTIEVNEDFEIIDEYEFDNAFDYYHHYIKLIKVNVDKAIKAKLTITDDDNVIDISEDVVNIGVGDTGCIDLTVENDKLKSKDIKGNLHYDLQWETYSPLVREDTSIYSVKKYNKSGDTLYVTVENTDKIESYSHSIGVLLFKNGKLIDNEYAILDGKAANSTQIVSLWIAGSEDYDEIIWYKD